MVISKQLNRSWISGRKDIFNVAYYSPLNCGFRAILSSCYTCTLFTVLVTFMSTPTGYTISYYYALRLATVAIGYKQDRIAEITSWPTEHLKNCRGHWPACYTTCATY